MIEFVEKNPWTDPSPFTGQTYVSVFMVRDGVEYFVVNRVVHDSDRGYRGFHISESHRGLEATKAFLLQNGGTYFKFNGIYEDPFEMLKEMSERGHTFCDPDKLFDDCRDNPGYGGGFVDFHGNRNEVSAAFCYRIYDEALLEKIRTAAEPIIKKSKRGRR